MVLAGGMASDARRSRRRRAASSHGERSSEGGGAVPDSPAAYEELADRHCRDLGREVRDVLPDEIVGPEQATLAKQTAQDFFCK